MPPVFGFFAFGTVTSGATGWAGSGRKMYSFEGIRTKPDEDGDEHEADHEEPAWGDDPSHRSPRDMPPSTSTVVPET